MCARSDFNKNILQKKKFFFNAGIKAFFYTKVCIPLTPLVYLHIYDLNRVKKLGIIFNKINFF